MADTTKIVPEWLSWNALCGTDEFATEVFRDQKGPWGYPRVSA